MLTRLVIENFRSIKHADIPLGPINAFVGPNNAGKSNILEALNIILGETYPSLRSFDDRDFHMRDRDRPISITAYLDDPIRVDDVYGKEQQAWGFQVKIDRYQKKTATADAGDLRIDFRLIRRNGNVFAIVRDLPRGGSKPRSIPVGVQGAHREKFPVLFVGINRNIINELRRGSRSFMGRILLELDKHFKNHPDRVDEFRKKMNEAGEILRTPEFKKFEKEFETQVKSLTGLSELSLGFRTYDPLSHYRLLELFMKETENGIEFQPNEMGTGTQSALAISLVRAYSSIVKRSSGLIIEEPELYLHPHASRYLMNSLQGLPEAGVQIFYSTHSPAFVDLGAYDQLHLVRRIPGGDTEIVSGSNLSLADSDRTLLKLHSRFDISKNEMFFARSVLLVEGPGDKNAYKVIPDLMGMDFDKSGISVVDTGNKDGMLPISSVLNQFEISHVCLVDADPGKPTGLKLSDKIATSCGIENLFEMDPDLEGVLGLERHANPQMILEFFMSLNDVESVPTPLRDAANRVYELSEANKKAEDKDQPTMTESPENYSPQMKLSELQ